MWAFCKGTGKLSKTRQFDFLVPHQRTTEERSDWYHLSHGPPPRGASSEVVDDDEERRGRRFPICAIAPRQQTKRGANGQPLNVNLMPFTSALKLGGRRAPLPPHLSSRRRPSDRRTSPSSPFIVTTYYYNVSPMALT